MAVNTFVVFALHVATGRIRAVFSLTAFDIDEDALTSLAFGPWRALRISAALSDVSTRAAIAALAFATVLISFALLSLARAVYTDVELCVGVATAVFIATTLGAIRHARTTIANESILTRPILTRFTFTL